MTRRWKPGWRTGLGLCLLLLACGRPAESTGQREACNPSAGGPYWLEEGETLTVTLSCDAGPAVSAQALRVEELPEGAEYEPETATLRWTPGLDQAAVYLLTFTGPGQERTQVKVGVADNWRHPDNVPVVEPTRYTEEYGLPVLHLSSQQPLQPEQHVPVTVVYRGHTYAARGQRSDTSSHEPPKSNYTLRFSEEDPFNEPEQAGGFTNRRSLVLINDFNDNSHLRTRLGYEVWSRLSPGAIQLKSYNAVVFLQGAYHGLYTVVDHVDEHLLAANGLMKDGNLYKAETSGANFRLLDDHGKPKHHLSGGFEKKAGVPREGEPGAFVDLEAFTLFIATSSQEDFRTRGPLIFNQREYEDWWALVTLLASLDARVGSAYHYHDPTSGRWRYIPWDMDGTFGQSWKTLRLPPSTPFDLGEDNGLHQRLFEDPALAGPLWARLRGLLHQELGPARLQARLDELARELGPSARRDEEKWGALYRSYPLWAEREDFTTFDQEVAYIRQWIAERWRFLDEQLR